ncbi:MAG: hypothetical protein DHS20C16_20530 [Phycisphaerae bacterium]|nr:MAG: hypothetical protein DHS20C16_20530 [Phycisphaerae bacterium]
MIYSVFFPELALLKDHQRQRQAMLRATSHIVWLQWVLAIAVPIVTIPMWRIGVRAIPPPMNDHVLLLLAIVMGLVWIFLPMIAYYKSIQQKVREQISSLGVPVCIKCGYQLQGIAESRCPECEHAFELAADMPISSDELLS